MIFPQLHKKLSFDPFQDFIPVALFGITQNALVAYPALPVSSVKELTTMAKSNR